MPKNSSWSMGNFIAVIILGGILIIGGTLLGTYVSNKQNNQAIAGSESLFQPVVVKTISYDGVEGKNALELLKSSHTIQTQDSSLGIFVTTIDETENTADTYWMFYVNDQLGATGADQYITKTGDKIEWRFEKYQ